MINRIQVFAFVIACLATLVGCESDDDNLVEVINSGNDQYVAVYVNSNPYPDTGRHILYPGQSIGVDIPGDTGDVTLITAKVYDLDSGTYLGVRSQTYYRDENRDTALPMIIEEFPHIHQDNHHH
jgi:hypothetical protein